MNPRILIADDHILVSKGLRRWLEHQFGYTEVNCVTSCSEVMQQLHKKIYTHAVLDLGLADGSALEILPAIKNLYPLLKIMILSAQPASIYRRALQQYGIHNYLSKESNEEETSTRLRDFFQNEPARITIEEDPGSSPFSNLAPREMEVLHYLLQGMRTNVIGDTLNIKWNTVSTIKNRIFEKTETNNIIELRELATMYRLI